MKRHLQWAMAIAAVITLNSCGGTDPVEFDETLLPGYWQIPSPNPTEYGNIEYWYYAADGTGYTWDTSEDIGESEAQSFTWTLSGETLTQLHFGNTLPKKYTVKTLTPTTLVLYDTLSEKSKTYTKTNMI